MKKKLLTVNTKKIKALNPCKDRLANYLEHYADFEGSLKQFFNLKNITYADKTWVAFRLMTKEQAVQVAALIAESVLHIYESKYPGDDRPRKAIEAAKTGSPDAADAAARRKQQALNLKIILKVVSS